MDHAANCRDPGAIPPSAPSVPYVCPQTREKHTARDTTSSRDPTPHLLYPTSPDTDRAHVAHHAHPLPQRAPSHNQNHPTPHKAARSTWQPAICMRVR